MTTFQDITTRPLPEGHLILPIQYSLLGSYYYCIMFAKVEQTIGKGVSKQVDLAVVTELLGHVPIPEVTALRGQPIVLYRPRDNANNFINDIIAIVKLNQLQIKEYNARANVVKIRGHSLYIAEEYQGTDADYSKLLYEGYLKLTPDSRTLLRIFHACFGSEKTQDRMVALIEELLAANELVTEPFMIGEILPLSVDDAFPKMDLETILQNVYQMVYTIAAYAAEGIYFRDLQPDNFRISHKSQVKLIDPSYIDASVAPENRYILFIKQTTPEYLPNTCAYLQAQNQQEQLKRYFGHFTEGVCMGMLERVLKRIFLPQYMAEKYDFLHRYLDTHARIEAANSCKFQEDVDFFRDVIDGAPSAKHFSYYQGNIAYFMKRENIFSAELIPYIARLLSTLRQFSYPVFTPTQCHSLLADERGEPMTIAQLPLFVQNLLGLTTTAPVDSGPKTIYDMSKHSLGMPNPDIAKPPLAIIPKVMSAPATVPVAKPAGTVSMPLGAAPKVVTATTNLTQTGRIQPISKSLMNTKSLTQISRSMRKETASLKSDNVDTPDAKDAGHATGKAANDVIFGDDKSKPAESAKSSDSGHEAPATNIAAAVTTPAAELPKTEPAKPESFKIERFGVAARKFGHVDVTPEPPKDNASGQSPVATNSEQPQEEPKQDRHGHSRRFGRSDLIPAFHDHAKEPPAPSTQNPTTPFPKEHALGEGDKASKTRKHAFLPFSDNNAVAANTKSTAFSEPSSEVLANTKIVWEFLDTNELAGIRAMLKESTLLSREVRESIENLLQKKYAVDELKQFFKKANALIQNQEADITLLRQAQALVKDEIGKDLERYAGVEYKHQLRLAGIGQKCKKILSTYLVYIAKTRYLVSGNPKSEIDSFLPKPDDDLLKFICEYYWRHHSCVSPQELANTVAIDVQKSAKR